MATQSKVIINLIFNYVLIRNNLHVIIIVTLFLKHIVKLEFRCLSLLSHLDETIDLIDIGQLLHLKFLSLLYFLLSDYSSGLHFLLLLFYRGL
jgi:hypothetical protein